MIKSADHVQHIVKKPWGYEYLAYQTNALALWVLHLNHGEATSMHCHPNKQTGFVLLSGKVELSFLADSKTMEAPEKQMIRRGLFHSTTAISEEGAVVLELETPNDKLDLVRLEDRYGREALGYEGPDEETSKPQECLWIEDDPTGVPRTFNYAGRSIRLLGFKDVEELELLSDESIIIFLRGGLQKSVSGAVKRITVPGDIGRAGIVKQVSRAGTRFATDTIALVI